MAFGKEAEVQMVAANLGISCAPGRLLLEPITCRRPMSEYEVRTLDSQYAQR